MAARQHGSPMTGHRFWEVTVGLPTHGWHVRGWGPGCQGKACSMSMSLLPHDPVLVSRGFGLEQVTPPTIQGETLHSCRLWPMWPSTPVSIRPFSLERARSVARVPSHGTRVHGDIGQLVPHQPRGFKMCSGSGCFPVVSQPFKSP